MTTTATVVEIFESRDSRVTLDALSHGWAEGRRVVSLDGEELGTGSRPTPGSDDLRPGSKMAVVVDPGTRRVTLELAQQ